MYKFSESLQQKLFLCNKNCFFVTKYKRDAFTKKIPDDRSPMLANGCTEFE
jgi:hypothetical protein